MNVAPVAICSDRGAGDAKAPLARLPRAFGAIAVSAELRQGRSALADLRQEGSARVLFPRGEGPMLEAALLNTSGGITDGDRFTYRAAAGPGAWLTLTTQAAERAYRARRGGVGRVRVTLSAAPAARLDWLPQETILFDGSALDRRLEADLAEDARFLAAEAVVFGRAARGERLARIVFSDQWRIRRGGRLVHAEALRLDGDASAILARPGVLADAGAMASVLYVAPDAEAWLAPVRSQLPATAGASLARPGVLVTRLIAGDGFELRRALKPVLETLRQSALPSMWKM